MSAGVVLRKCLDNMGGRGGGNANFAQGVFDRRDGTGPTEYLDALGAACKQLFCDDEHS